MPYFAQNFQFWQRLFQNFARDGVVSADVAVHVADKCEGVSFVQRAACGDDFPTSLFKQIVVRAGRVLKGSRRQ